jgi:hypothetical protein
MFSFYRFFAAQFAFATVVVAVVVVVVKMGS